VKNIFLLSIGLFATFPAGDKNITIYMAGDSTMAIKETRAYPETGWGMPFTWFWDSTVTVVNRAKNGRSTKTFVSEGLWKSIIDEAKPGDYILIQFGHNDESVDKKERYSPPDSFKRNLTRFISDARSRKAIPILLTPVGRRKFDSSGRIMETHFVYSQLTREVAAEQKIEIIDLDRRSQQLYQDFGPEASKLLFLQLKRGEHPNYPDGKEDNTHFNELGARLVAQLVLEDLRIIAPELTARVIKPKTK